jgi:exoribonuclease R
MTTSCWLKQKRTKQSTLVTLRWKNSSTVVTSFNHNWRFIHLAKVIIDFLESLRTFLQLPFYHPKMIQHLTRSNSTKKQFCLDLDRIWHQTLNSYNYSFRSPKVVIHNMLESLWKKYHFSVVTDRWFKA